LKKKKWFWVLLFASIFLSQTLILNLSYTPAGTSIQSALDPSPLTTGVSSICAVGVPGPLWVLDSTPLPVVAGDEDTTPVPSVVAIASRIGNGHVVALGHEGFLTNEALDLFDNKRFGNNIVDWLDKSGKRKILVTTGHREWYGGGNFDDFKKDLENRGYTVTRFSGTLTASGLSDISAILVGNAWGNFSNSEIDALRDFADSGGGLLLMGLGWSWEPYNPGSTLDDYPMNKLGKIFGIRWINGYISDPTNNYNGQPIFHTFYPNIGSQTIYQAFSHIDTTTDAYPSDLPSLLQNNASVRSEYTSAHLLLATATIELSQSSIQRQEIYNFYKNLIGSHPQYFQKNIVYNKVTESTMAWLRERIYRSFIDALPLTADRKNEVSSVIGLTDRYLDIWDEFSVLLLDNTGLNEIQKDFIYAFLSLVPKDLHNLRAISVADYLGVLPPSTPQISLWGRDGGVNIFGIDIGVLPENGFPEDVPPKYSDVFCLVVAHEVNHVVDAFYISRDQNLGNRKDELIRRAGDNHMNYLRSMLPDGFFTSAPQEFFASISNQWFADSALTLKLALTRFDKGYNEPLNQFLFFAEVYSGKGYSTLFYTLDTQANITRRELPIFRDKNGRINAIVDSEIMYFFTLDEDGNAISYLTAKAPSLRDFDMLLATNNVRMIYPSDSPDKPLERSPAMVSDWLASAFVYTKLENVTEGLDTDSNFVNQTTGNPVGVSGIGIISFGGPVVNVPVYYYEVNKIARVVYCGVPGAAGLGEPWSQWCLANGSAIPEAAIGTTDGLDLFLIEMFPDPEGRCVFIAYGIGWKGTYAAGKYFHRIIYPNLDSYNVSWVIVKWMDTNGDGFVNAPDDGDTYTILASSS